jgi:hypothetical protein
MKLQFTCGYGQEVEYRLGSATLRVRYGAYRNQFAVDYWPTVVQLIGTVVDRDQPHQFVDDAVLELVRTETRFPFGRARFRDDWTVEHDGDVPVVEEKWATFWWVPYLRWLEREQAERDRLYNRVTP